MNILHKVTRETLKKNRTRTLVTLIGVILSSAMLTAVTTAATSFKALSDEMRVYDFGNWHGLLEYESREDAQALLSNREIESGTVMHEHGYAENIMHEADPYAAKYLRVISTESNLSDFIPIQLTAGKFPSTPREILLPESILYEKDYKIGDMLTLEIGTPTQKDGKAIWSLNRIPTDDAPLQDTHIVNYTVSGFYMPISNLESSQLCHTLITAPAESPRHEIVYFRVRDIDSCYKDPAGIESAVAEKLGTPMQSLTINDLIILQGNVNSEDGWLRLIYSLCVIVIVLIVGSSIALIHNAFAISISERTKQFGILSSVGATGKQLHRMILYEAFYIGGIGIPVGIISGLLGLGIAFYFVGDKLSEGLYGGGIEIPLRLKVSFAFLLFTFALSMLTVLVSAFIPAKHAEKTSAIEAIRQTPGVKQAETDVKASAITLKLFGFPAYAAKKYYKRSRKKYRSTIFSLSVSVVLFVVSSALVERVGFMFSIITNANYDIVYMDQGKIEADALDPFADDIRALPCVDAAAYGTSAMYIADDGQAVWVNFIEQTEWDHLLEKYHLDKDLYNDAAQPLAIAVDGKFVKDPETQKRVQCNFIESDTIEISLQHVLNSPCTLKAGIVVDDLPFYCEWGTQDEAAFAMIYPVKALETLPLAAPWLRYYIKAEHYRQAERELTDLCVARGYARSISTPTKDQESINNVFASFKIFAGGFIALITMIAIANVFNTISTNVSLRRRDFAMLKSVGMSDKEVNKMLQYECLIYGERALLYGLPTAMLFVLLMNRIIAEKVSTGLSIPWSAMILASVGVFIIVAVSMQYASRKLRTESPVETLKNENL